MFDANAAYIKVGESFFAEVHCIDEQLELHGVSVGDIVLCEHIEKGSSERDNLVTKIFAGGESDPFEWVFDEKSDDWSWMVYSGRPNGEGFISEPWKQKALAFLGGRWKGAS